MEGESVIRGQPKMFYFVSGPRDGEPHWALDDLAGVTIEMDVEEDWQNGGLSGIRVGCYTVIGNLLVWEGWLN